MEAVARWLPQNCSFGGRVDSTPGKNHWDVCKCTAPGMLQPGSSHLDDRWLLRWETVPPVRPSSPLKGKNGAKQAFSCTDLSLLQSGHAGALQLVCLARPRVYQRRPWWNQEGNLGFGHHVPRNWVGRLTWLRLKLGPVFILWFRLTPLSWWFRCASWSWWNQGQQRVSGWFRTGNW